MTVSLYKRKTQEVIDWLWENGSLNGKYPTQRPTSFTIPELQELANTVAGKEIPVPDAIFLALRTAITARTEVAQFYKDFEGEGSVQVSNESHNFFINRYVASNWI